MKIQYQKENDLTKQTKGRVEPSEYFALNDYYYLLHLMHIINFNNRYICYQSYLRLALARVKVKFKCELDRDL